MVGVCNDRAAGYADLKGQVDQQGHHLLVCFERFLELKVVNLSGPHDVASAL